MADARPVGDILADRRVQLKISLDRAVSDTKLRRSVIEAFEATDFEAMPPRGYAQASLASYARYLGIPSQEIVPLFERQLDAYERQHGKRTATQVEPYRVRTASGTNRDRRTRGGQEPYGRTERGNARSSTVPGDRNQRRGATTQQQYSRKDVRDLYDEGLASRRRRSDLAGDSDARTRRQLDERAPSRPGAFQPYSSSSFDAGAQGSVRPSDTRVYSRTGRQTVSDSPEGRIDLNDGYLGGSGAITGSVGIPAQQPSNEKPRRGGQDTITVREIAQGFAEFFAENRIVALVIVGAVSIVFLVLLCIAISSCSRAASSNLTGDDTMQVEVVDASSGGAQANASSTAAQAGVQLAESIDLANLTSGTVITVAVDSDAPSPPWVEAYIDDVAAGASNVAAGTETSWTMTRSARILLSTNDHVNILVNGVAVSPTYDNGTYALNLAVPEQKQPVQLSEKEAQTDQTQGDEAEVQQEEAIEEAAAEEEPVYEGYDGYEEYSDAGYSEESYDYGYYEEEYDYGSEEDSWYYDYGDESSDEVYW